MNPLWSYNFARVNFIKEILKESEESKFNKTYPFKGKNVLDVGCGGGLLSEVK